MSISALHPASDPFAELENFNGMYTRSDSMLQLFANLQKAANADVPVFIWGETGTGKELTAKALQTESRRRGTPFVSFNCANFSESLMESQLFGHLKGSFTGAIKDQEGLLGAVNGGTLFLDEVTSMDLSLQAKLLRVLQEREYCEIGSITPKPFTGQIISASQISLEAAVSQGYFREDLRYRLEVISINLPPLRERREDVLPLFQMFLRQACHEDQDLDLDDDVVTALDRCFWPGNIRQLQNTALFAKAMCDGQRVEIKDLPADVARHLPRVPDGQARRSADDRLQLGRRADDLKRRASDQIPMRRSSDQRAQVSELSRDDLQRALDANAYGRARTAKSLGVSRMTLWRAMKKHGLIDDES